MIVKIVNKSSNELPEYSTQHAAGMDLRANLIKEVIMERLKLLQLHDYQIRMIYLNKRPKFLK